MNVLIVGYRGFIGQNLFYKLKENKKINITLLDKNSLEDEIESKVRKAELIFLVFGVNKEKFSTDSFKDNYITTKRICSILKQYNKKTNIIFTSSIQAKQNNSYGKSKLKAERILLQYKKETKSQVLIYRLPNIFGKWSKPNYNSVVATFCFNISRNKKINISNNNKRIKLFYIDDLVKDFINRMKLKKWSTYIEIRNTYSITLLKLANLIRSFNTKDNTSLANDVSKDFVKKIFSTYVSFLPNNKFKYMLKDRSDNRGSFVEFLKNEQFGQFSYFSILPKRTRGNHFHHTKLEKFVVISGKAKFNFVNIKNRSIFSVVVNSSENLVVNSIPGWAHNIENTTNKITKILVWCNEILDKNYPDTYSYKIK
jgi:UDP-2-acetamido-2,6-beta-L-arabino-hexul-4-ose reductase